MMSEIIAATSVFIHSGHIQLLDAVCDHFSFVAPQALYEKVSHAVLQERSADNYIDNI